MENTDNKLVLKVFSRMFLGLLATAIIAIFTYKSNIALQIPYWAICIAEIVVVLLFSFLYKKLPPIVVTILFFVYAILTGLTFSSIFIAFDLTTIGIAFLATAGLFGLLAAYGYFTKKDVSKIGPVLMIALFIGLIVSIINIFLKNSIIELVLDWVILLIFAGLTIYDINRIKSMAGYEDIKNQEKLYVYGAMELYLDFINMFLRILSLISNFKDN